MENPLGSHFCHLVLKAWPNGTIIALNIACAQLIIGSIIGDVGDVWIGTDNTVTSSGGGSAFAQITPGGYLPPIGVAQYNALRTTEAWMAGTLNDKVGVAAIVI